MPPDESTSNPELTPERTPDVSEQLDSQDLFPELSLPPRKDERAAKGPPPLKSPPPAPKVKQRPPPLAEGLAIPRLSAPLFQVKERPSPVPPPLAQTRASSVPPLAAQARASSAPPPLRPRERPSPLPAAPDKSLELPGDNDPTFELASRFSRATLPDAAPDGAGASTLGNPGPLAAVVVAAPFEDAARELVARCEALLTEHPPAARAARLHYEIARLCERPLQDARRASAHYQQAYDRVPDHLPTIRGLRRTLIARRALRQALALYDAEARLTSDPRLKARLMFAKGRLLEDGLALRAEARQAYRAALDLSPSDPLLLKANEQCESLADEWAELSSTYARQANVLEGDPKQRAALLVQKAQLLESRLRDPEGAIAQYETALELDPEAHDALEALKRLYYARGRYRDLVRVLELNAASSEDPQASAAALHTIARIHADKLGNRPDAIAALERALDSLPNDRALLEELAQLKEAARDYRGLSVVLARLVDLLGEAPDRAGVLHRIGQLYDEHLADPEAARAWFERALALDACYTPALAALGNLHAAAGRHAELMAMHLAEAAATRDSGRRAAAHARVAEILELRLGDVDGAIEHHHRALSAVPLYAASFKALTRLFAALKRHRELTELYERALEQAEPERAISYLLKIGALYEDHLGDPNQAMHAYRRILDRDPKHWGAVHALQRAAEAAGRYPELVEALTLEAELSTERNQRVALLCRAGEVLDEQLNDREAAVSMLKRVVALDPRYVPALTALGRMYYRAGRWDDLLALYHAELAVLGDDPRAAQLLFKMGELTELRLGRPAEATDLYRRAAQADPSSSTALRAFARKLREQGRWEELLEVLGRELKQARDAKQRAAVHFKLAEVHEFRLDRPDAALEAYDRALAEDRTHAAALEAQVRLRAARGEHTKLADDLARNVELTPDPARKTALLMQLGELLRDQLRDLRRAIACFEEVRAVNPAHHGALFALEGLYRKTNQWAELSAVLSAQADVFVDLDSRTTALRELTRVAQRGEPDRAAMQRSYAAILELSPDDVEATLGLEGLALENGDADLLRSVDERISRFAADRALRAAHLTRLAELLEPGDPRRALGLYRSALENDPENLAATRGLSRLAARTQDAEVLRDAGKREAEVLHDKRAAAELYVRAADARLREVEEDAQAALDLERALELDPENERAAFQLRECLSQGPEVQRLTDLLARAAGSCRDKLRAAALWREVAHLYADQQANLASAISALNRALRLAPDDVHVIADLAALFRRDGQWNEAKNLLTRVIAMSSDRQLTSEAHTELAAICDEHLGDSAQALVHLRAALLVNPDDASLLRRLSELLSREGEHAEAVSAAQHLVEVSRLPDARVGALLHLAKVEQRRGDRAGVARALIDAVASDGPGGGAGAAMREAIGTWVGWTDYEAGLRKYVQSLRNGMGAPTEVYLELARIQAQELDAKRNAIGTLREAIARQPGNLSLRAEHAALLRSTGALEEAANELRLLLVLDVERLPTWRALAECFNTMAKAEARARTLEVLRVLGAKLPDDAPVAAVPLPDIARERALSGAVIDEIAFDLSPFGVAGELLASLVEGLDKLYPPDLDGYGVHPRDKLTPRSGHPFRTLAERVAEVVGAEDFELYVHRARTRGVGVELGSVPILLFPAWLLEQSEAHQTFMLARVLSLRARNCHPVLKLTPRELEVLFAAYARTVSPGFGRGLTNEELLDEQGKRLHRALSRRARKAADEAVQRYVAETQDLPKWCDSRDREATRAAALLSENLAAVLESVGRLRSETRDAAWELRDESIRDLLRFWVSEPAFRARATLRG